MNLFIAGYENPELTESFDNQFHDTPRYRLSDASSPKVNQTKFYLLCNKGLSCHIHLHS